MDTINKVDILKTILAFLIATFLYLNWAVLSAVHSGELNEFTYKDGQVLYNLCSKKPGSQTNFILKSYGEEETKFKEFLIGN